jgi:aryl-alcohol dehydrogenase-like predicted oxidoreductase
MKFNRLGRTDISVSEICLGTMTWGSQNSETEAHAQMDHAIDGGINFFDTAELYPTTPVSPETYGRTEEYIGSWFKKSGRGMMSCSPPRSPEAGVRTSAGRPR